MLDSKDQVTQELYEILEDLFEKARSKQPEEKQKKDKVNRNDKSYKRMNIDTTEKHNDKERKVSLSQLSYKELSETKTKLNELKDELKQNPRKYSKELKKIDTVENKMDIAMKRRKQKDINKSIQTLNKNPRHYILKVVETKGKLAALRVNLEKNPRENKNALDKINKLEQKLDVKIENLKSAQINKAIYVIQKNPKKYNQELNKYKEIQRKLMNQKENNKEKNLDKTKETSNEKIVSTEVNKPKEKAPELSL